MVHTFEILYILNRREAAYCALRLNQRVNDAEKFSREDIQIFLRPIRLRRNSTGINFKGLRIPGIHQISLVKYKDAPGCFFLYIMIEPEVLLTGENTLDVFYCSFPNLKELQQKYAQAIFLLWPKAFEGRPHLSQVRYHDQKHVQPVEWSFGRLFMTPHLSLAILSRIDFCVNCKLDNANLYVEMIKKSYYHSRKKNKKFKNLNPFSEDKSHDALFYDKTSGFCIYNKFNKMMDPAKDNMHNIDQIREDARDVIRIERPFYKITKEKLYRMSGLIIPKAQDGKEPPLKMGPLPLLWNEKIGLYSIFKEYQQCVLGIKRNRWHDIVERPSFKWVSTASKKFNRKLDSLLEEGRITQHQHDTILKMAYATSEARSVKRAVHNCNAGTEIWWEHDEDENKIRIPFHRSAGSFIDTWHDMYELGMMLLRIPGEQPPVDELDANFIFDTDNWTGIGTMLEKEYSSHYDFLPYKVIRAYDSPDPLELQYNYEEITRIIYQRFLKYMEDSEKAYQERMHRRRTQ